MGAREDLERYVVQLEAAYNQTFERLKAEIDVDPYLSGHLTPEMMRDATGRFILLDALAAIVEARSILAASEPPAQPSTIVLRMPELNTVEVGQALEEALAEWRRRHPPRL